MRELILPLDEKQTRDLNVGEQVVLTGKIFTGRESFYIRAVEENILPELDYSNINVMMHVGPVMKKDNSSWEVLGLTPTTSIRMEKYAGILIEKLKTRALIGKGTMGKTTTDAMKKIGAVHLAPIAIYPVLLARQIVRVERVFFLEDIGATEATWIFDVKNFGPFLVDIDSKGNNYFNNIVVSSKDKLKQVYDKNRIPLDYKYTEI
ncbi:fumarate hydratase C-terminal domain-containing protein [bacterium]|nr:fumarate hydratase C-terminal domain-containing protein [bacterium]